MQLARLLRQKDGVEGGYRVAKEHYSSRHDYDQVKEIVDGVFANLTDLCDLVTVADEPGPQLRLAKPA